MWFSLFVDPIMNILVLLHFAIGGNGVWAIVLLTFIIRLTLVPMGLTQHQVIKAQESVQGEISKVREEHQGNRKQRIKKENEIYRRAGINPLQGCIPLLLQFPILVALNQTISLVYSIGDNLLLDLSDHIYAWVPNVVNVEMDRLFPLTSEFLWFDLSAPDSHIWLPLLVTVSFMVQQIYRLITTPNKVNRSKPSWVLQAALPILIGVLSLKYSAGLSVYLIASNILGALQAVFFDRIISRKLRRL